MERLLAHLHRRLGPRPRVLSDALMEGAALPGKPDWMEEGDGLAMLWTLHPALLARGELAAGWLFMANNGLWEAGTTDAPAGVVYSFDPLVARRPGILPEAGGRLFARFKDASEPAPLERDPWQRRVRSDIHSGLERYQHERVPPSLSQGYAMFHGAVLVCRDHLPDGKLSSQRVPLLVLREGAERFAMIAPSAWWSEEARRAWCAEES